MSVPGSAEYRHRQRADLLRIAANAGVDQGFGWLGDDGGVVDRRPVELWITCRMTHVLALGVLAAEDPASGGPDQRALEGLVAHGVSSLAGAFRDDVSGGWFTAVNRDGPIDTRKRAYDHAFVVLAASSATAAGVPGASAVLAEALAVSERRFWDDEAGLVVEEWDRGWTALDPYRGLNANMHVVEAYLAAGDVTGDPVWHRRAARICRRVQAWAAEGSGRLPEHFDASWVAVREYNSEQPADPFRPYGATVGHGFEWARLLLAVDAATDGVGSDGMRETAIALYRRARQDGWAADGADGFVYTTDWVGRPVVHQRLHWVVAEAVNAAEVLFRTTGDPGYIKDATAWWEYADRYLVDPADGSWRHELDPENHPADTIWSGRPDLYHAYQAALLPSLPTVPSFARALADRGGLGDTAAAGGVK